MGIQQQALGIAAQQGLMRMLAVDIDQRLGHLAQLLNGHRGTVEVGTGTAAGIEDTPQQQSAVSVEIALPQPDFGVMQTCQVEFCGNLGSLSHVADQTRIGAIAKRKRQRIDQNRLAGTGLAGERTKPGRELKLEAIDQNEVSDCQPSQHDGISLRKD